MPPSDEDVARYLIAESIAVLLEKGWNEARVFEYLSRVLFEAVHAPGAGDGEG